MIPLHRLHRTLAMALLCVALATLPAVARGSDDADARWYRIAFAERITQAQRDAVVGAGATALQYWPHDAYLAWIAVADVPAVEAVAGVAAVEALAARDKLTALPGDQPATRLAVVARGGHGDDVAAALPDGAVVAREEAAGPGGELTRLLVTAAAGDLAAIAAHPAVLSVGPAPVQLVPDDESSAQMMAGNVVNGRARPGYEKWLADRGIDGSGVRVAVVDTGVDPLHPDLRDRIARRFNYTAAGNVSQAGETVDSVGHGTHVAGIVGGNATGVGSRSTDPDGLLYGLGVAPKVTFVDAAAIAATGGGVLCGVGTWPPPYGFQRITKDALSAGAAIWNASWQSCEGTGVGYIESVRTLDTLARDGDWTMPGAQPFTLVFSAGNSGDGATTRLTAPHEGKNMIVVASTDNVRNGAERVSGFSSRGPAVDGRIVPTVAAPGGSIVSTRSTGGAVSCATPMPAAPLYSTCSGTSMAAPHATGAVALLTQWWRAGHDGADPSPAMSRALLVNTAKDIDKVGDIPNKHEGWGRIDTGALFDPAAQRVLLDQQTILSDPGEGVTLRVTPADPTKPLRVTVAWTDQAGATGAKPALVNDLDLVVTSDEGQTWRGNAFAGGRSMPGGAPDRINNLENVFLPVPSSASYTVTVSAHNLPGNGVPFAGDDTDQDFALVISNAVAVG